MPWQSVSLAAVSERSPPRVLVPAGIGILMFSASGSGETLAWFILCLAE